MTKTETSMEWRKNNPEKWKEIQKKAQKKYFKNNKEKVYLRKRKWIEKNKQKNLEYNEKSRRKKGIKPKVLNGKYKNQDNKKWLQKIALRDGGFCKKCGSTERLTLQHIKPRCIGGEYSYENLEILCFSCNIKDYHQLVKKSLKLYFENIK